MLLVCQSPLVRKACRIALTALAATWCWAPLMADELTVRGKADGLFGDYKKNNVKIYFDVTSTASVKDSKIWRDNGPMTELHFEHGTAVYKIAGHRVSGPLSEQQKHEQIAVMTSPEADLVPDLFAGLKGLGMDPKSGTMTTLAAGLIAYERGPFPRQSAPSCASCTSALTHCAGCCSGPGGCSSCSGICTNECAIHDACVAASSYFNPLCNAVIEMAVESWVSCWWSCSGSNCSCCHHP